MNPDDITLDALLKKHPERVKWESRWSDYVLAYRGGHEFLAAAGTGGGTAQSSASIAGALGYGKRTRRFLWQLEGEPDSKYASRLERASYINYVAAIIDYFRHWLYSQPPQIRPTEQVEAPNWWAGFCENASGGGLSFVDVARDSFLDVLLCRRAGWLIGSAQNVAGRDDDNRVVLTPYGAGDILDWQQNACGELDWITLCKEQTVRAFPDDRVRTKVITYLDRQEWHSWEVRSNGEGGDNAEYLGGAEHGLGEVPFVLREIPHGLWVADKLFSPCMSLFNRTAMLEYGEHLGCYLQAYMRTHEGRDAESRILGEGLMLNLRAAQDGRGQEEFGYVAPDISPMAHMAERLRQDRDEIYRSVHQMAMAVDSQATTAVARSGASKIEDRRATEIILAGYGRYELRAMVQTANLISKVQGDNTAWVGDGFDNFQTSTLDEELQIAALAQAFNIKSPTFNAELQRFIALGRVLPHLDEATKQKIETEIRDSVEADEGGPVVVEAPPVAPGDEEIVAPPEAERPSQEVPERPV